MHIPLILDGVLNNHLNAIIDKFNLSEFGLAGLGV